MFKNKNVWKFREYAYSVILIIFFTTDSFYVVIENGILNNSKIHAIKIKL